MNHPRIRRKRFLVMPKYQLAVALRVFFFVLLYSLPLAFLIFYPLQQELMAATRPEEQVWISRLILELHARMWPGLLAVAVLVGLHAILTSHRIVGPLYRIDKVLKGMAAGDYSYRITLRRGDGLQELADVVNHLGEQLNQRRAVFLALIQRVQGALQKAQEESTTEEVQKRLTEALQNLQEAEARSYQGY